MRGVSMSCLTHRFLFLHNRPEQRGWLPREASLHLLLATPQSSIPRDMSLDLVLQAQRMLLKVSHPLKTILLKGQSQTTQTFQLILCCTCFNVLFSLLSELLLLFFVGCCLVG